MRTATWISFLSIALSLPVSAQSIGADIEERIDRGLDFLCRTQREDGSWEDRIGRKIYYRYVGRVAPHVGVTALAGMSLLASCVPDVARAPEERIRAVRKAAGYIASQTGPDGFITAHGSRMYSHAFATVFLSRLCRADPVWTFSHIRKSLQRAVILIVDTQNAEGGWRYLPGATDSDLLVTAEQLIALAEARLAGMEVPETTLTQATLYLRDSLIEEQGAFRYQVITMPRSGASRMSFTLTASGLAALSIVGHEELSTFRVRCLDYLARHQPDRSTASQGFSYYYAHYGAAQAALYARALGEGLYGAIRKDLLLLQEPDGRWIDSVGSNYATAVATLILQAPRLVRRASEETEE